MRLFTREEKPDAVKMQQAVSEVYGAPHPEAILGYAGAFLFCLGDIYISDGVEKLLDSQSVSDTVLEELLARIHRDDFGDVSKDEEEFNIEQRYIAGSSYGIVARYSVAGTVICCEGLRRALLMYVIGEDVQWQGKESLPER